MIITVPLNPVLDTRIKITKYVNSIAVLYIRGGELTGNKVKKMEDRLEVVDGDLSR